MQKSVRIAVAAVVAVAGLGISLALSQPPHQVAVGILTQPAQAGMPIPANAVKSVDVPASYADAGHLLAKAQIIGFIPSLALPTGMPLNETERLNTNVPAQEVALPLSVTVGNAENVHPGGRVAIYTVPSGQQGGVLDASGVKVLNVITAKGASTTTDEIVLVETPTLVAASLVGETLVMANMGGNPATHWFVTGATASGGTASSTATSSSASPATSTAPATVHVVGKSTSKG